MSAGLPGVGLSGLFFIFSALFMVPLEIARTIRGHSSLARWVRVLRHATMALAMIVCVELVYAVIRLAVSQLREASHLGGAKPSAARPVFHLLPVTPIVLTLGAIVLVLLAAKAAQLLSRRRSTRALQAPRPVATLPAVAVLAGDRVRANQPASRTPRTRSAAK